MTGALDDMITRRLIASTQVPSVVSTLFSVLGTVLTPFEHDASGTASTPPPPPQGSTLFGAGSSAGNSTMSFSAFGGLQLPAANTKDVVAHACKMLEMTGKLLLDDEARDYIMAHLRKFIESQGKNGTHAFPHGSCCPSHPVLPCHAAELC